MVAFKYLDSFMLTLLFMITVQLAPNLAMISIMLILHVMTLMCPSFILAFLTHRLKVIVLMVGHHIALKLIVIQKMSNLVTFLALFVPKQLMLVFTVLPPNIVMCPKI